MSLEVLVLSRGKDGLSGHFSVRDQWRQLIVIVQFHLILLKLALLVSVLDYRGLLKRVGLFVFFKSLLNEGFG